MHTCNALGRPLAALINANSEGSRQQVARPDLFSNHRQCISATTAAGAGLRFSWRCVQASKTANAVRACSHQGRLVAQLTQWQCKAPGPCTGLPT